MFCDMHSICFIFVYIYYIFRHNQTTDIMSRLYRNHGHSPYDLGVSDDKLFPFSHQLTDHKSAVSRHERALMDSPLETIRQLFYGMGNGPFGDLGDFKENASTRLFGRVLPPKRAFDTQEPWKLFTNSDAMITNGWFVLVPNGMTTTSGRPMSVNKPAVEKLQFSQELCGLDECRVDPALRDYLESEGRRFLQILKRFRRLDGMSTVSIAAIRFAVETAGVLLSFHTQVSF